jgi:DnaJ-domain-containing protein 1
MLEQRGLSIAHNPNLEPAFLMSQIELREELDDISETASEEIDAALSRLDGFKSSVKETLSSLEGSFAVQFDVELAAAEQTTYKMQFMNKLLVAADQLEEQLLDY